MRISVRWISLWGVMFSVLFAGAVITLPRADGAMMASPPVDIAAGDDADATAQEAGDAADAAGVDAADTDAADADVGARGPRLRLVPGALLEQERIFLQSDHDYLWQMQASEGRVLMRLPLDLMEPGSGDVVFGLNDLRVRGGRFVAYDLREQPRAKLREGADARQLAAQEMQSSEIVPRFTRRFVYTAADEVTWRMDRVIPGATVIQSDRAYAYKLNMDLMEGHNPGPRPMVQRQPNELPRDFAERRTREMQAYQEKQRAYLELRQRIMQLPAEFSRGTPRVVWVVFEVIDRPGEIEVQWGEGLSWRFERAELESLRRVYRVPRLAAPSAESEAPAAVADSAATLLGILENTDQSLTWELVLKVVEHIHLTPWVGQQAQVDALLRALLASTHAPVSEGTVDLLVALPQRPAALAMIEGRTLTAAQQAMQYQALLQVPGVLAGEHQGRLLGRVAALLADEQAPSAASLLGPLDEAMASLPDDAARAQVRQALWSRIDPAKLPQARCAQLIDHALTQAAHDGSWQPWIDGSLLTAQDRAVRMLALERLARVTTDEATAQASPDAHLLLQRPLQLMGQDHPMLELVKHEDAAVRSLAWRALAAYEVPSGGAGQGEARDRRIASLLAVAHQQTPFPPGMVTLLKHSRGHPDAATALVALAGGDDKAIREAATEVLKDPRINLAQALINLSPEQRVAFAVHYYGSEDKAPLSIGLLRSPVDTQALVGHFARMVSRGQRPDAKGWYEAIGQPEPLLRWIAQDDREVALAAAGTLLGSMGDHDQGRAILLASRLGKDADLTHPQRVDAWRQEKRLVYFQQLKPAAGRYTGRFILHAPEGSTDTAPRTYDLQALELVVRDNDIAFAGKDIAIDVDPERRLLRIRRPAQLGALHPEAVADLDLERVNTAMELHQQADGSWKGQITLTDMRRFEVVLQPHSR